MPKPAKPKPKATTRTKRPAGTTSKAPKATARVKSLAPKKKAKTPSKSLFSAAQPKKTTPSKIKPKSTISKKPTQTKRSAKTKVQPLTTRHDLRHSLPWGVIALASLVGLIWQTVLIKPPPSAYMGPGTLPKAAVALRQQFRQLSSSAQSLLQQENAKDVKVVNQTVVQGELSVITTDLSADHWGDAKTDLAKLNSDLGTWQGKLKQALSALSVSASITITHPPNGVFIPILLYHQTPADFEQQLIYIRDHGYTTITMDQVAAALTSGAKLPAKPVVISFDDGYSDQWGAFQLLQQYQMKAIYYIIIVRANSGCEPDNPSCNPDYLSWDQVKALDASGLVTIGDHTVDHPDLTTLDSDQQQSEIVTARTTLQAELGHPVVDFAYPYGSYNTITLGLLRQDGFRTAVTTVAGQYQLPGDVYELHRIRLAYDLP